MPKPRERNFLEAVLENAEAYVDAITDNEALRQVPVIGTALKVCKGMDDLRSRVLMAKLAQFIEAPALQPARVKLQMQQKLRSDPETQAAVGETLFLVIEKVTNLEKPGILAKAFAAYLDDLIDSGTLMRLAHAIDLTFLDDLQRLAKIDPIQGLRHEDRWGANLIGPGFAAPDSGLVGGGSFFRLTPLAKEFIRVMSHVASPTADSEPEFTNKR